VPGACYKGVARNDTCHGTSFLSESHCVSTNWKILQRPHVTYIEHLRVGMRRSYSTNTDWVVCRWPWQLLALGKPDRPSCFVNYIRAFSIAATHNATPWTMDQILINTTDKFTWNQRKKFTWLNRCLAVTSSQCIPVKNALRYSRVVFCVCKIVHLFSVVCSVITAVHKFDRKLVINGTPSKWSVERRSRNDTDSSFWKDLYVFLDDSPKN
jgi:hypothetical protein